MSDDDAFQPPGDHDYRPPAGFLATEDGQEFIKERLAQLPTRVEMYCAVLLGITAGAGLVQCLAWLFG